MDIAQPARGAQGVTGRCIDCEGPVRIDMETDGNGLLVERVYPCKKCHLVWLRRLGLQYGANGSAPRKIDHGTTTCPDCGEVRNREYRGRRLARCPSCKQIFKDGYNKGLGSRAGRKVSANFGCPKCGDAHKRAAYQPFGDGVKLCAGCANGEPIGATVEP